MKTTVEISDALLEEAKRLAEREGTTLRELVESGLRSCIKDRARLRSKRFRLRRATFAGRGLQSGVSDGSWEQLRELAYERRGA